MTRNLSIKAVTIICQRLHHVSHLIFRIKCLIAGKSRSSADLGNSVDDSLKLNAAQRLTRSRDLKIGLLRH